MHYTNVWSGYEHATVKYNDQFKKAKIGLKNVQKENNTTIIIIYNFMKWKGKVIELRWDYESSKVLPRKLSLSE